MIYFPKPNSIYLCWRVKFRKQMRRRARYTRQRAKKRRDGVECDRKLKISPQETISSRSSVPSPPWHHAIGNVQWWPLGKHRLPLDAVLARLGSRSKTVLRKGKEYVLLCIHPKDETAAIDRFTAWEDGFHRGTSSASVKFYTSLLRRIKQAHLNERTKTTVKSSILGLLLPLHLAMESDISGVRLADN